MGDTAYGRLVALRRKYLTSSLVDSTKNERYKWRARIYLMDVNLVGYDREIDLMAGKDRGEGAKLLFILD